MNVWRRGSLAKNPYARTAFRVARVPRELTQRRTIVQLINRTRKVIIADPQVHVIDGEPVTLAELNVAEQLLLDPRQRIQEELLEHAAERPPLEQVRKLAAQAAQMMAEDGGPLPATNMRPLGPWALELARQFLETVPAPDPSFGALELSMVPPFGRLEEA